MPSVLRAPAARVWFFWTLTWNVVVLATMWPAWILAMKLWPTSRTFWTWLRAWAWLVLTGCGFRVEGAHDAPRGPVVYAANHQAMLDIPALALGIPAPFVFVARSELRRLPLVGSILAVSRCVFLDRRAPGGTDAALEAARERLEAGESVLLFPEGTRSYGRDLGRFYPGAFRLALEAGVSVVPVAIDGAYRLLDENGETAQPGRVTVKLGAPIEPSGSALEVGRQVRAAVNGLLP
ncbi:lysophospholipid acyltransferase family protein [Rubrivirga sp.]|uniref:lysophospholipid acyltransferase family protein n=1 Tax=Rubrivirga sp. TaxID=1885344 RepID=UPI003C76CE80